MAIFDEFYGSYRAKLFAYLIRMTGDYPLSCDILQESFTRILEHYGPNSQSPALLYKIARNAVRDTLRKNDRNRPLIENQESLSVDPEQHYIIREAYRKVLAAMQHLEDSERDTLSLVVSSDFSYRQIAALTGISEANVKVKVHRARTKLRQIFQGEEP